MMLWMMTYEDFFYTYMYKAESNKGRFFFLVFILFVKKRDVIINLNVILLYKRN